MVWTVTVAKPAQKQVARFPARDQLRIAGALLEMVAEPFSGDTLKLEGAANRFRRRVGSYRIFFALDTAAKTVAVSAITRRTSQTY